MADKLYSIEEIVTLLRQQQGGRTQKEYADLIDISEQYLCDLYKGRREPGPTVLKFLKKEDAGRRFRDIPKRKKT